MSQVVSNSLSAMLDRFFNPTPEQGEFSREPQEQSDQNTALYNRLVTRINSCSSEDLQKEQERVRKLFFEVLPSCAYNRAAIEPKSSLELTLDRDVYLAHDAPDRTDIVTGRRIHETIAEARFAWRLGVQPTRAHSDFHEVYYLLDRAQEKLGVFKPAEEMSALEDAYGASESREAHLAEVANSRLDDFLKTHLVPYTQLLQTPLGEGSFQFYVSDAPHLEKKLEGENFFDPDHSALTQRLDTLANRELKVPNFETFAFFDLITANNDHHFRNILSKNDTGEWVAIDNSNSFPWCHNQDLPSYKMRPLHWFKWSTLPHAKIPFSPSMIDNINSLDPSQIEGVLRESLVHAAVPSSLEHIDGKIKTFYDRFRIVKELANQGASMADIATAVLQISERNI